MEKSISVQSVAGIENGNKNAREKVILILTDNDNLTILQLVTFLKMTKQMSKWKCKEILHGHTFVAPSIPKKEYTTCWGQNREKPQKKTELFLKNLSLYFSQFCESTTIHGIKYVGQRGRYFIERLIWMIVIVMICTTCLFLIQKTYIKWKTSPVIVTFEPTETPISQIPFPAITLCPVAKMDPEIFNFTKTIIRKKLYGNLSKLEKDRLKVSLLICDVLEEYGLSGSEYTSLTIDHQILNQMVDISPALDPLNLTRFKWLGAELNNPAMPIITSEGICYTFNMLPYYEIFKLDEQINNPSKGGEKVRKWSLEDGYPPGDNLDSYPRRTFVSGIEGGLTLDALVTNHSHLDFLCENSVHGYKVALHHPAEMPNMEKHFRLPLDHAVFIAVKPTMITVSKKVMQYEPQNRQCYFAREKYLSMYKLYTQQNCLSECLTNYTLSECGCLPFYVPTYDFKAAICGPGRFDCIKKIEYLKTENSSDLGNHKCGCLPSCTSLSFDVETSQTDWDWQDGFKIFCGAVLNLTIPNTKGFHLSRLVVYYKDLQFLGSKRSEMYGYLDLFSNVGGLLGLFIGFSVTSVIEILYFLTLRLICNIKKYGKKAWCGEPDLVNVK